MQSKFRAADACVCEDTKDYYYDLKRQPPRGFEVVKVEFGGDSRTAQVHLLIEAEVATMGGRLPVKAPAVTTWRVENEKWCFYLTKEQQSTIKTPFAQYSVEELMKQTMEAASKPAPFRMVTRDEVMSAVEPSASGVVFRPAKPASAEITLTNTMPGKVEVERTGKLPPGVDVTLSAKEIGPKGSITAKFTYTPGETLPERVSVVQFVIEPTRQVIPIRVRFELPESAEPKDGTPQPFPPKQ